MPEETKQSDFSAMSAPTADHKRLTPFVGTFRAEVKIWMGPGDPNVSTGTMTNTFELGGRFLRQEFKGDPNDGPFPAEMFFTRGDQESKEMEIRYTRSN